MECLFAHPPIISCLISHLTPVSYIAARCACPQFIRRAYITPFEFLLRKIEASCNTQIELLVINAVRTNPLLFLGGTFLMTRILEGNPAAAYGSVNEIYVKYNPSEAEEYIFEHIRPIACEKVPVIGELLVQLSALPNANMEIHYMDKHLECELFETPIRFIFDFDSHVDRPIGMERNWINCANGIRMHEPLNVLQHTCIIDMRHIIYQLRDLFSIKNRPITKYVAGAVQLLVHTVYRYKNASYPVRILYHKSNTYWAIQGEYAQTHKRMVWEEAQLERVYEKDLTHRTKTEVADVLDAEFHKLVQPVCENIYVLK